MPEALEETTKIQEIRRIVRRYKGKGILIKSTKTRNYHFGISQTSESSDRIDIFHLLNPSDRRIETYSYNEVEEIYPVRKNNQLFPK